MSNSAKKVSLTTRLRRAKNEAETALATATANHQTEVADLQERLDTTTQQLQNSHNVIDGLDQTVRNQREKIIDLVGHVADSATDIIRLHQEAKYLLEKQATKAMACFGVINAVATDQVSKNDLIVLLTNLCTTAPDELLAAAEVSFKALIEKRKAEREAREEQKAYDAIKEVGVPFVADLHRRGSAARRAAGRR